MRANEVYQHLFTRAKFKLGIGIPLSWNYVPSDFFHSWTMLNKHGAEIIRGESGPIHEMRNAIVIKALELDCTHLLFLDADMVYPSDTISRLLDHNVDIVSALMFKRLPDFEPILFTGEPYKMTQMDMPEDDGLVEVTATGTGCLLINTKVFDGIDPPWFMFGAKDGKPVGEDILFCYRAVEAGFKIHVDTSIQTEHLTMTRVNLNLYQMQKKLIKQGAKFNF